jgi:hypothetical protein
VKLTRVMLDDLILLRLLAAPDAARGETRSKIIPDLRPIFPEPKPGHSNWLARFAEAADRLARAGCLTLEGRNGARMRLTDAGRDRARAAFDVPLDAASPAGVRWAWWRDRYALPRALGVKGQAANTAEGLRVALLRRFYLPELSPDAPAGSLLATVDLLLAKRLRTPQARPTAFRMAALRDWAKGGSASQPMPDSAASSPNDNPPPHQTASLPDDPHAFAGLVRETARHCETGRFGDNKVFISHVWGALLAAGQAVRSEEPAFKDRLVRANTGGLLRLSRADLAGAHDVQDVHASETRYLGESFHFLRLD